MTVHAPPTGWYAGKQALVAGGADVVAAGLDEATGGGVARQRRLRARPTLEGAPA